MDGVWSSGAVSEFRSGADGPAFRDTAEYSRSQRMTCVVRWSSMWSSWNHACLDSYRLRVVGSGVESIWNF